jgi:hypothetical protein
MIIRAGFGITTRFYPAHLAALRVAARKSPSPDKPDRSRSTRSSRFVVVEIRSVNSVNTSCAPKTLFA